MKAIYAAVLSLLITVTQALAYGGVNGESPSLLMTFFLGFGALIIVFQLVPAVILFGGMLKGLFSSPAKTTKEAAAVSSDKNA